MTFSEWWDRNSGSLPADDDYVLCLFVWNAARQETLRDVGTWTVKGLRLALDAAEQEVSDASHG